MNKAQLVDRLAEKTRLTKTQTESFLEAALSIIQDTVSDGQEVKLVGFGTFSRTARKARPARNPRTGESVTIPSQNVPRFKPGKEFKEQANV